MVTPPIQAPRALPTLKAAMLAPEARVGALLAYFMTRICSPGTVAKPKPPSSTMEAMVIGWLPAVRAKTTSTTTRTASTTSRVRSTFLSAALPPTVLPMNSPTPKRISSHGTVVAEKPVTSVRVKAM